MGEHQGGTWQDLLLQGPVWLCACAAVEAEMEGGRGGRRLLETRGGQAGRPGGAAVGMEWGWAWHPPETDPEGRGGGAGRQVDPLLACRVAGAGCRMRGQLKCWPHVGDSQVAPPWDPLRDPLAPSPDPHLAQMRPALVSGHLQTPKGRGAGGRSPGCRLASMCWGRCERGARRGDPGKLGAGWEGRPQGPKATGSQVSRAGVAPAQCC